ncbi:hypothetical protein GDO81_029469 [Engystomops pustulosus]|uniref:Uncharacterized protein n=1 Tax=Engystomops pustulosus TaxID=76066 RepID=A0AAV6ZHX2_ENGPU|nr:hypothetical protein GDO81_029469 [Engystomops pustulosus]
MASADLRDELDYHCLETFTDPVMLRCGHNFCRVCIDQHLSRQDESLIYSCPECREKFVERPALMRNITLSNIVRNFLLNEPRKEVSSDPGTSLENRKCSVHNELFTYYCPADATCICVSCILVGEHQRHRVELLDEAYERKKTALKKALKKRTRKRVKTEERVQSLEERRRKAQEKASGEAERVTALFIDIRRRLDDLEKRVLTEISRQEKEKSLSLSAMIKKLEIKKDELSMKIRHMEELCNMTDPLTVLQEPDTGDLCDPEEGGDDEDTGGQDNQRHYVDGLDVTVISDTLHTLCDIISGIRRGIYVEDPAEILWDANGVAYNIYISDDQNTVTRTGNKQNFNSFRDSTKKPLRAALPSCETLDPSQALLGAKGFKKSAKRPTKGTTAPVLYTLVQMRRSKKPMLCFNCGHPGHVKKYCRALERSESTSCGPSFYPEDRYQSHGPAPPTWTMDMPSPRQDNRRPPPREPVYLKEFHD